MHMKGGGTLIYHHVNHVTINFNSAVYDSDEEPIIFLDLSALCGLSIVNKGYYTKYG